MYGIVFIVLGNLAGNAIAMGRYVLFAAGKENPEKGEVLGLAIGALTIAVLLHVFSRRGGIVVSNVFAAYKVALLLVIIILGFAVRGGADFRKDRNAPKLLGSDFHTNSTFSNVATTLSSYTSTFFYVLYAYSGFEQPFYVSGTLIDI
jgi:amino acid transporter